MVTDTGLLKEKWELERFLRDVLIFQTGKVNLQFLEVHGPIRLTIMCRILQRNFGLRHVNTCTVSITCITLVQLWGLMFQLLGLQRPPL